jgi:hypothetical protein
MGRIKLFDSQFQFKWNQQWVERLRAVAESRGEDAASVARRAVEREIERREQLAEKKRK